LNNEQRHRHTDNSLDNAQGTLIDNLQKGVKDIWQKPICYRKKMIPNTREIERSDQLFPY
jgi:hypothetical protein